MIFWLLQQNDVPLRAETPIKSCQLIFRPAINGVIKNKNKL